MNRLSLALGLAAVGCTAAASSDDSTGDVDTSTASASADTSAADSTATATATATETTAGETSSECESGPAAFTEIEGCSAVIGQGFCSEGQSHVEQGSDIQWMSNPPHSGPHYPTWETWGEHDELVPRGNWVHNLEHGGIVLGYRCNDDCLEERAVLSQVVAMRPDLRILMTRDPMLSGEERFAAISWTWVHRFDAPDLAELLCFVDQHENHAPEDVP